MGDPKNMGKKINNYIVGSVLSVVFVFAGLFVWLKQNDLNTAWMFFGFAVAFPLLFFFDEYITGHSKKVAQFLETLGFLPRPSEAYLYVASLSVIVLAFFSDIWHDLLYLISQNARFGIVVIYFSLGILYSIYFAFSERARSKFENEVLRYYCVILLISLSVALALRAYEMQMHFYWVFVIWNGVQAVILFFFSGGKQVGDFITLPTRDARRIELVAGTLVVLIVLGLEKFFFKDYWAVAFSTVLFTWSFVERVFYLNPKLLLKSPVVAFGTKDAETKKSSALLTDPNMLMIIGLIALLFLIRIFAKL